MIPELHRFLRHCYPKTTIFLVAFVILYAITAFYLS